MNKLQQIIAYFCLKYANKTELSKARVTKLVYLADWFSSLVNHEQLTNIEWIFNHYGPYVDDVIDAANQSDGFTLAHPEKSYGSSNLVLSFHGDVSQIMLSNQDMRILDIAIARTQQLRFKDFIDFVYSTYPVKAQASFPTLTLVELADNYRKQNAVSNKEGRPHKYQTENFKPNTL